MDRPGATNLDLKLHIDAELLQEQELAVNQSYVAL
jgi:hypothetical protein